jgi:VanZ family protein
VLGIVLAVALQMVQLWLPDRLPALWDAVLNVPGIALGLALGILFERSRLGGSHPTLRTAMLAPMVLALLWIAYQWFPLVPTIDLQTIRSAIKPLLLEPRLDAVRVFHDLVAWLAFFRLLAFTPARRLAPLWLAAGAILILLAQPLFVGNTISANNVAGLAFALVCMPVLGKHYASPLIVAGVFVSLLLSGLRPFELALVPNTFQWIPFSGFLGGSMATNALSLLHKCFFYGAAIYLLRDCGSRPLASAVTVAVWLAIIEGLQVWIVGRTAEITDPLLALMLAWTIRRLESEPPATHNPHHDRRSLRSSPRMRAAQSGSLK